MSWAKIVRPEDDRKVIRGAGDEYSFMATGKDTDGSYFFVEAVVPPGGGPPPHIQTREEEGFYVTEGELVLRGKELWLRPARSSMFHAGLPTPSRTNPRLSPGWCSSSSPPE